MTTHEVAHMLAIFVVLVMTLAYISKNWDCFNVHYRVMFVVSCAAELCFLAFTPWFMFLFASFGMSIVKGTIESRGAEDCIKEYPVWPKFETGTMAWYFTNSLWALFFVQTASWVSPVLFGS